MTGLGTCCLCGNGMNYGTKLYWIIDPETLTVKGQSHKGCRDKLKYPARSYTTDNWEKPTPEVIRFSDRMIKTRNSLPQWVTNADFKVMILLSYTFQYSDVNQMIHDPEITRLFNWWIDDANQVQLAADELKEVKRRLVESLAEPQLKIGDLCNCTHPDFYRSPEFFRVIDIIDYAPAERPARMVYVVEYPDGEQDKVPVVDPTRGDTLHRMEALK